MVILKPKILISNPFKYLRKLNTSSTCESTLIAPPSLCTSTSYQGSGDVYDGIIGFCSQHQRGTFLQSSTVEATTTPPSRRDGVIAKRFFGGRRFLFGNCRKGSFSALGSPKNALRAVQGLTCISTNVQGPKKSLLSCAQVFLLPCHVSMTKKNPPLSLSRQGFQWPLCSPDRDSSGPRC